MTIHAVFVAHPRHMATESPAPIPSKPSADTYGSALTIAETRNAADLLLLGARRLSLIKRARDLRLAMRCKAASTCEAELRAVTLHILAMGDPA